MNAYTEGREAYHDGVRVGKNPYAGSDAGEWQEGWFDAYDEDAPYGDDYDDCDCDDCRPDGE